MYEIESGHKVPKVRRKAGTEPKAVREVFEDYAAAYKAVYGVRPLSYSYNVETKFISVDGNCGVSLKILRERTKQLRYRKG